MFRKSEEVLSNITIFFILNISELLNTFKYMEEYADDRSHFEFANVVLHIRRYQGN